MTQFQLKNQCQFLTQYLSISIKYEQVVKKREEKNQLTSHYTKLTTIQSLSIEMLIDSSQHEINLLACCLSLL